MSAFWTRCSLTVGSGNMHVCFLFTTLCQSLDCETHWDKSCYQYISKILLLPLLRLLLLSRTTIAIIPISHAFCTFYHISFRSSKRTTTVDLSDFFCHQLGLVGVKTPVKLLFFRPFIRAPLHPPIYLQLVVFGPNCLRCCCHVACPCHGGQVTIWIKGGGLKYCL